MPLAKPTPAEIWSAISEIRGGSTPKSVATDLGRGKKTIIGWTNKYESCRSIEEVTRLLNPSEAVYVSLMRKLFEEKWTDGTESFVWDREDLPRIAGILNLNVPKNLGDNIYSIRHGRSDLPVEIRNLAPTGKSWLLLPHGKSSYRFVLAERAFLDPDLSKQPIKIPDSTPQIVARYAKKDEQAVLARIRYCRLVDIFMGLASYQIQSHMRTTIAHFNNAQTELDEIYVGVDGNGSQFVIPIQAKSSNERIGAVQLITDHYTCIEKFPQMIGRLLAAKTVSIEHEVGFGDIFTIAIIEAVVDDSYNVRKRREEHFKLLPSSLISDDDLNSYRTNYRPI